MLMWDSNLNFLKSNLCITYGIQPFFWLSVTHFVLSFGFPFFLFYFLYSRFLLSIL